MIIQIFEKKKRQKGRKKKLKVKYSPKIFKKYKKNCEHKKQNCEKKQGYSHVSLQDRLNFNITTSG